MTLHTIEAEVLGVISGGYRLKVSVLDIGMYILGFTARRSEKLSSGWWIQPPAIHTNGKWKYTAEFDKSKSLWPEIESACIHAVALQDNVDTMLN
jgi:hypothetical protein